MRQKTQNILSGLFRNDQTDNKVNKNVQHYRNLYKTFDEFLTENPEIERLVHNILKKLCELKPKSDRSRTPDYTTQNLFRAVIVMRMENLDYRGATIAIAESATLQNFCRLFDKETINHSLICQAAGRISPEIWHKMNTLFGRRMIDEKKVTSKTIRTDGTVVETNIHHPTDSSLCWDSYRTIDRLVEKARDLGFGWYLRAFRFHPKKIKQLNFRINRFAKSKDKKRKKLVRKYYRTIINRTGEAVAKAKEIVAALLAIGNEVATAIAMQLNEFLPWMERIVDVARRRFNGEKVPNSEKVFSLFERHTELIIKGKQSKPIEFGHLVRLAQTREKFILDYVVYELNPSEMTLLPEVIERHAELYKAYPENVATDKGYHPGKDAMKELVEKYKGKVKFLGVPARTNDFANEKMGRFQRFRAGIEGTISFLKRCFGLSRCVFKGFRGFCRFVGSAVFCHNMLTMARAKLAPPDG